MFSTEKKLENHQENAKDDNRKRSFIDGKIDTVYPELLVVVDYETFE